MTEAPVADSSVGTALLFVGLLTLVAMAFVASLAVGPAGLAPVASLQGLLGGSDPVAETIMREIRLPRALLGVVVGASLGLAGAALQGFLRNPLAEPGLIGVSASAALGAVLVFYFGLAVLWSLALPLGGIAGALAATITVQVLAGRETGALTLILAGVAITSFAGAATSLALNLAPSPFAALEIVFWLLGSLSDRSFQHLWLTLPFVLGGGALLLSLGRALDALTLGEDAARSLGFNLYGVRQRLLYGTALAVGAATAVTGAIGFVGLVVPHLLRPLVGEVPSRLLLPSALGGAAMILTADVAVRVLTPGSELKLGVLTALVGAPFFLMLILKSRRQAL